MGNSSSMIDRTSLAIVADIGGTNARFSLVSASGVLKTIDYLCEDFSTISDAIRDFMLEALGEGDVNMAYLAVAAPVAGDDIKFINNPNWNFSRQKIQSEFGFKRFDVMNDFYAVALGVQSMDSQSLIPIRAGAKKETGNKVVLGPGTGLGIAGLIWDREQQEFVIATGEGGHQTFAARTDEEFAVLKYLQKKLGHVSYEQVCSGQGLQNLYEALTFIQTGEAPAENLKPSEISHLAINNGHPIARQAMDLMIRILGRAASNMALSCYAEGGVYIAGGIIGKIKDYFLNNKDIFIREFEDKGNVAPFLEPFPVFLIEHKSIGLQGLERRAQMELTRQVP
jgi:glucokinase